MAGLQPPLMPGWTEHTGPEGQLYWYSEALQQSTYTRPTSHPPGFGGPVPVYTGPPPSSTAQAPPMDGRQAKGKKEKPAKKETIAGASGWLRVTTTLGNIFYTHVETKRSEWTVPEEIREQVEAMEDEERRIKAVEAEEERLAKEEQELENQRAQEEERERRVREEEEERKRRQEELRAREEAVQRQREEHARVQEERRKILQEQGKRKRDDGREGTTDDEADKKVRLQSDGGGDDDDDDDGETAWQREVAAEMAEQAEREQQSVRTSTQEASPPKLELTAEEGKALFSHMLSSLNGTASEVNPMAPWDKELPKFVHQRDYTVLSSVRDRQEAFNEWCKLRLREKRSKASGPTQSVSATMPQGNIKEQKTVMNAGAEGGEPAILYRSLLESEVQSTRTRWDDFKKTWKKDRRFFAFGRDDREREKAFRGWLKELGEKKRQAAEKGEKAFIDLLGKCLDREHRLARDASTEQVQAAWARAKQTPGLYDDARYEAVGSSSRRAELYSEWARGQRSGNVVPGKETVTHKERSSQAALQEREEAVQRKRVAVEGEKRRAFGQATREESMTSFRQLLVDAVRDPLISPSEAMRSLTSDGRFEAPGLRLAEKEDLVRQHIGALNDRRLAALHDVFARHATALDTDAEVALPLIKDDGDIERRKLLHLHVLAAGPTTLDDLFHEWSREREREAAQAFQKMLDENAFVNFWGRLRQEHEQRRKAESDPNVNDARQGEADDDDEDEPDLLRMAANVDLDEVHSILRNDQRYRAFRHRPQQREEWIRRHLQGMSVPKQTVYQRDD